MIAALTIALAFFAFIGAWNANKRLDRYDSAVIEMHEIALEYYNEMKAKAEENDV